jgi:DNA-binding transcriptional ArsR family regulator
MHKLLTDGDTHSAYATWNRQRGGTNSADSNHAWAITRAIAADAARNGWTRSAFTHTLLNGPHKAGAHARQIQHRHGYDRAHAWLARAWDGAQQHVNSTDRIATRLDFHASLAHLRARIERTPWKGIAGKTDLRNLIARLAICEQAGSWDHTVSERDLAERMGCSQQTARTSNRRLKEAKLLRQLDQGTATDAARWMLISPSGEGQSHGLATHGPPSLRPLAGGSSVRQDSTDADIDSRAAARLMAQDAFAHFGLGGSGLAITAALAENDGQTVQQIQGAASVSRPTVYRQLKKLAGLGLVVHVGELYHLSEHALEGVGEASADCPGPVESWEDAAFRLGTHGMGERRRKRHEAQREHWERERARLAERRRTGSPEPDPRRVDVRYVNAGGEAVDPVTGEVIAGLLRGADGGWILV